ncbi:MAG: hypothetical protein DMD40_08135 [Gemmatimonadetes bacterium]|nr:MAG: hypothetical protein DMD40_08135 [Gemmatimonadota bacterium]
MRAVMCGAVLVVAACGPPNPCSGHQFDRLRRYSLPYAGHWVVARGDTMTFPTAPGMSDRFRLGDITLDTATVVVGRECLFRGHIVFRAPRADTVSATWFGQPEQAIVSGWPADLGPFAGVSLAWSGRDSLGGAILLDSKLGVQAKPGMTARFVAGRAQRLSSQP